MKNVKGIKILLIALISSLAVTGIAFIDEKIWDAIFVFCGMITYLTVGSLYSIGLLKNRCDGQKANVYIFLILIFGVYGAYKMLIKIKDWINSNIFLKTIVIIVLVSTVILIVYDFIKNFEEENN